jgi:signal transduction histidine kinase/response regulator RpfG family c-di-GMP phosphodiesterase
VLVTIFSAVYPHENNGFDEGTYRTIESGIQLKTADMEEHNFSLPHYLDLDSGQKCILSRKLPDGIQEGEVLFLYTANLNVRVYIGGVCVGNDQAAAWYPLGEKIPSEWYMVKLHSSDSDQQLKICYDTGEKSFGGWLDKMYLGDKTAIIYHLLRINAFTIVASFLILLGGIFILVYYLVALLRKEVPEYACLSFFMIMSGLQLLMHSPMRQAFMQNIGFAQYMERILAGYTVIPLLFYMIFMGKNLKDRMILTGTAAFLICAGTDAFMRIAFGMGGLYSLYVAGILALCLTLLIQFIREVEQLQLQDFAAYELNEEKSVFLAEMSHAIRTPVNTITGMNSLILRESTDPGMLDHAADIRNAVSSLLSIMDDILDFSSIETGKMQIVPAVYDLSSLINDCYNMIIMRAQGKGLTLRVENNRDIPSKLQGDEMRIRQIIINLLTNAVKYTRRGEVLFQIDYEKVSEDGINLIIHVKDTGIGIRPENIDQLFVSYERVDEKINRGIEGTGLGLSITRQLVTLMNGQISVESEYGKGTVFTVILPQKTVSIEPIGNYSDRIRNIRERLPQHQLWFQAPDAYVLVVDDVKMNLRVMEELFSASRMHVDLADGGEACLKAVTMQKYDLIFLDHMMPAPDGIETFRRMRQMEGNLNRDTPIIMLTANAVTGAKQQYLEEGFSDYLAKPVEEAALIEVCRKYLTSHLIFECGTVQKNEPVQNPEKNEIIKELSELLNVEEGLKYCMNKIPFYLEMLHDFAETDRIRQLQEFYVCRDTDNYRITVHALKSTAKTIGADDFSEKAKELEQAAREEKWENIEENHELLVQAYGVISEKIRKILKTEEGEKKPQESLKREELIQLLKKTRDCAGIMDMDGTDEAIGKLTGAEPEDILKEKMQQLQKAGNELEFDRIQSVAEEMLKMLDEDRAGKEGCG